MADRLTWLLFESQAALASAAAFILFWLLVHWRRSHNPRPLLIALLVALVLLGVQSLVVTRREAAAALLDRVEAAIVRGRADELSPLLSADFHYGPLSRPEFIEFVRVWMERVQVQATGRGTIGAPQDAGERFSVEVPYLSRVSMREWAGQMLPTRWRIVFVDESGVLRITDITPLEIADRPVVDPLQLDR